MGNWHNARIITIETRRFRSLCKEKRLTMTDVLSVLPYAETKKRQIVRGDSRITAYQAQLVATRLHEKVGAFTDIDELLEYEVEGDKIRVYSLTAYGRAILPEYTTLPDDHVEYLVQEWQRQLKERDELQRLLDMTEESLKALQAEAERYDIKLPKYKGGKRHGDKLPGHNR